MFNYDGSDGLLPLRLYSNYAKVQRSEEFSDLSKVWMIEFSYLAIPSRQKSYLIFTC